MFSCEYCGICKGTYFEEHQRTAVSEVILGSDCLGLCNNYKNCSRLQTRALNTIWSIQEVL